MVVEEAVLQAVEESSATSMRKIGIVNGIIQNEGTEEIIADPEVVLFGQIELEYTNKEKEAEIENCRDENYEPSTEDGETSMSEYESENEGEKINETKTVNEVVKRKRKPDRRTWKRQENKTKRQKGEDYKGVRKNEDGKWIADRERAARTLKPACNCKLSSQNTKLQCRMFSENDRNRIFEYFWKHMSWSDRKIYVHALVDVVPTKDKKKIGRAHV